MGVIALGVAVIALAVAVGSPPRVADRDRVHRSARIGGNPCVRIPHRGLGQRLRGGHDPPGLSWFVRLAGLWGGAEGSLLFWTALMSVATTIVFALGGESRPASALTAAYGAVVLVTANPFDRLDAPAVGGLGLQPVLEHAAMTWHPPLLYVGLIGMIVPSLLALGGATPPLVRRATAVTLAVLTLGLATGAAWAHAELGWGGYWAWDPIESAGLVAWLAAAATLHLCYDRGDRRNRMVFLVPAVAAVWATTLTRAGLTPSVHSFADRPALRAGLLVTAVGWTAMLLYLGLRVDTEVRSRPVSARSKGAMAVLLGSTLIVAVGTYEPAVETLLGDVPVSIAGVFFARSLWPLIVVGATAAVLADRRFAGAAVGAAAGVALTPLASGPFGIAVAAAGGAIAGSALDAARRGRPGWLAHTGVGIVLVGVAGTMGASVDQVILIKDRPTVVAGQTVVHRGIELRTSPTQEAAVATIEVDGAVLQPQLVAHRLRNIPTAEAATRRSILHETQVLLSGGTDGQADYRIQRMPRLNLVWLGCAVLVAGLGRAGLSRTGRSRTRPVRTRPDPRPARPAPRA